MYPPILDSSNLLPLILLCSLALFVGGLHFYLIYTFFSGFNRSKNVRSGESSNYRIRKRGFR